MSSDPDLSTTMLGKRTSMLTIASVSYRHSGTYTCRASNPAGSSDYSSDLVVNGNLKAIKWPRDTRNIFFYQTYRVGLRYCRSE